MKVWFRTIRAAGRKERRIPTVQRQISARSLAMMQACARFRAPSFAHMVRMVSLMLDSLPPSLAAISLFVAPSDDMVKTLISRPVRSASDEDAPGREPSG